MFFGFLQAGRKHETFRLAGLVMTKTNTNASDCLLNEPSVAYRKEALAISAVNWLRQ